MRYVFRHGRRIAVETLNTDAGRQSTKHARHSTSRHIGCPLSWFRLVFPVVHGKNELAVALFIYRLCAVHRSKTVAVANAHLLSELGIDRFAKYRALQRLAKVGLITIEYHNKRTLKITLCQQRGRRRNE
jgi:hypothetical protein